MQTRQERSPSRTETKSTVERKVRIKYKEEESRGKEIIKPSQSSKGTKSEKKDAKPEQKDTRAGQSSKDTGQSSKDTGQSSKDTGQSSKDPKFGQKSKETGKEPVKKGIMSESMRELVRQSIKESKGLAHEVVEEESDESPEHFFQVCICQLGCFVDVNYPFCSYAMFISIFITSFSFHNQFIFHIHKLFFSPRSRPLMSARPQKVRNQRKCWWKRKVPLKLQSCPRISQPLRAAGVLRNSSG
jgi:hypothetical protein